MGVKVVPLTPAPKNEPPEGVAESCTLLPFSHTAEGKDVKAGEGVGFTFTVVEHVVLELPEVTVTV